MATERPFPAYTGDAPPIFVCYSHADAAAVFPEIARLHGIGASIWYDEGIEIGQEWRAEIAEALDRARVVLFFQSRSSVESRHCVREIGYALDRDTPVIRVLLDDCSLPPALALGLQGEQAIDTCIEAPDVWRRKLARALAVENETAGPNSRPPSVHRNAIVGSLLAVVVAASLLLLLPATQDDAAVTEEPSVPDLQRLRTLLEVGEEWPVFEFINELRRKGELTEALSNELDQLDWGVRATLDTAPSGARVSIRRFEGDKWFDIGTTPIENLRTPGTNFLGRIEKTGYRTRELHLSAVCAWWSACGPIPLRPVNEAGDMELVPSLRPSALMANYLVDLPADLEIPGFEIDRHETTNREYQAFVDAGGYAEPRYWSDLEYEYENNGQRSSWDDARNSMIDATGEPGPAGWEFGAYLPGTAEHPVGGISWYEAMAYARFRGKALPTVYHWISAVIPSSAAPHVRHSNFGGSGPAPVGASLPGHAGTFDAFGNVREWLLNETDSGGRWIQGGGWDDPPYFGLEPSALPPMDRNPRNGVRLARYPEDSALVQPKAQTFTTLDRRVPVGDEAYGVIRDTFRRTDVPLAPRIESQRSNEWWRQQIVRLGTADGEGDFRVHLFLPPKGDGPFQAIIQFPWSISFLFERDSAERMDPGDIAFLPRSGRAVVQPVWLGAYERFTGWRQLDRQGRTDAQPELLRAWYSELGRTLDYLESRDDIDSERIGYFGYSIGGNVAVSLLALEPRLKAAVLSAGGVGTLATTHIQAAGDPVNFLPRVTQPVLMLNGEHDFIFPVASQQLMFDLLGTPEADKQHVVFPLGHGEYPEREFRRLVLDWYDRYLGPTERTTR